MTAGGKDSVTRTRQQLRLVGLVCALMIAAAALYALMVVRDLEIALPLLCLAGIALREATRRVVE